MWFKDKILQGRFGQFKNCRNLLIWRAQSVIWRLHTDLEQHTLVGHGVQCSLFWRKSGQKWRYSSREAERSRELLQQNCLLKQACHQKHFREKVQYCLWNRNWKGVRGEKLWLSCSLGWLDTALNDLCYLHHTSSVLHLWESTPELYREADKEVDCGWSLGVRWKDSVCIHSILHPSLLSCAWERSFPSAADELTFPPQHSFGNSPAAGICLLNFSLYISLLPAALINETGIEVLVDNRKEMWCQPSKRERL